MNFAFQGDLPSLMGLLTILAIYFIPFIIAILRRNRNTTAIFILNLLLGWTFFGWAVALVWAFVKNRDDNGGW